MSVSAPLTFLCCSPFLVSLSLFHFLLFFTLSSLTLSPSFFYPSPLSLSITLSPSFFHLLSLLPFSLSSILPELQCVFGHLLESKLQYYAPENFWKKFKLWGQPVNVREQQVSDSYTWKASLN